jgi:integrase-like protein
MPCCSSCWTPECLAVELEDIDDTHQRVLVRHGKGLKQRWVGIGERAQGAVRNYIERFRGERPGELFLTSRGDAMSSVGTLEVILRRIGERASVTKVHPHRFRHRFATWAIQSGAREIDVQLLLGHADLTMTQRYARTYSSAQAVRAHARLSPVGQLEPVGEQPESDLSALRQPSLGLPWLAAEEAWQSGVPPTRRTIVDDPNFERDRRSLRPTKGSASSAKSSTTTADQSSSAHPGSDSPVLRQPVAR